MDAAVMLGLAFALFVAAFLCLGFALFVVLRYVDKRVGEGTKAVLQRLETAINDSGARYRDPLAAPSKIGPDDVTPIEEILP